uniref:Uncharacterized protein n=1 Tax=Glossina palpalis gambiensis TaxID=67801 RepID=A0A1B0B862_9MUSC
RTLRGIYFNNIYLPQSIKYKLANTLSIPHILYGLEVVSGTVTVNFTTRNRATNNIVLLCVQCPKTGPYLRTCKTVRRMHLQASYKIRSATSTIFILLHNLHYVLYYFAILRDLLARELLRNTPDISLKLRGIYAFRDQNDRKQQLIYWRDDLT